MLDGYGYLGNNFDSSNVPRLYFPMENEFYHKLITLTNGFMISKSGEKNSYQRFIPSDAIFSMYNLFNPTTELS